MKKTEKTILVDNLSEELKAAKSVVLINYAGMNTKAMVELKGRLKEAGSHLVVVKNTLLKLAGEKAHLDKEVLTDTVLEGQNALILSSEDPIAPLQIIAKFTKEFEVPKMRVGIVEGTFQDEDALSKLSTLPSRDILLGSVLGALMASQYGLVGTLNGNLQKLVYILDVKAKNSEA